MHIDRHAKIAKDRVSKRETNTRRPNPAPPNAEGSIELARTSHETAQSPGPPAARSDNEQAGARQTTKIKTHTRSPRPEPARRQTRQRASKGTPGHENQTAPANRTPGTRQTRQQASKVAPNHENQNALANPTPGTRQPPDATTGKQGHARPRKSKGAREPHARNPPDATTSKQGATPNHAKPTPASRQRRQRASKGMPNQPNVKLQHRQMLGHRHEPTANAR